MKAEALAKMIEQRLAYLRSGDKRHAGYGHAPVERRDMYDYDMEFEAAIGELEAILQTLRGEPR